MCNLTSYITMRPSEFTKSTSLDEAVDQEHHFKRECKQLQEALPKASWFGHGVQLYPGFWYGERALPGVISLHRTFQALDTDIFLASKPKCGTTWLKALAFAIVNRHRYRGSGNDHPLLKYNPHELVPFLEYDVYMNNPFPDLTKIPSPRIFATHQAYQTMPESVKTSKCRTVYICRNPLDAFTSAWHFYPGIRPEGSDDEVPSLEAYFEQFCKGFDPYGPFFDHVLGYWNESLKRPQKVLFLKYEDMRQDIIPCVKRIAGFLGYPFSLDEEEEGRIEEISGVCSYENLKHLETNKSGTATALKIKKGLFFRKADVGDWVNLLSPSMVELFDKIMKEKLEGTGLTFNLKGP